MLSGSSLSAAFTSLSDVSMKFQCCVISGESGAGKTVTSNYLVEQLATLSKHGNPALVSKILQVSLSYRFLFKKLKTFI